MMNSLEGVHWAFREDVNFIKISVLYLFFSFDSVIFS